MLFIVFKALSELRTRKKNTEKNFFKILSLILVKILKSDINNSTFFLV